jgi:4-hydroxythreonine-4-phosphate dehydrogenase
LHFKISNKNRGHDEKKAENIIVGISIGDLNGIGSEVVKTFEDSRMLELCTQ